MVILSILICRCVAEVNFPGLQEHLCYVESATPLSHYRFTNGGSAYGAAAVPLQFGRLRQGPESHIDGFYFTGHSTRDGHGILGACAGGARVARRVMKDL